jgi:hypothetical protein
MGGLGNQLFQISHAMCQGWKNNIPSIFKPISYTPMQGLQPDVYFNNIFRKIKFNDTLPVTNRVTGTFNYNEVKCDWSISNEFYGFYQSSKYFLGYDEKLKDLFKPTKEFKDKLEKIYPEFLTSNSLSLHIRRGDYLNISNILPVIDVSYIDESIKQIGDYDTLYVFTQDKEWVRNNLNYKNMIIVDSLDFDYEELWMISLCKNNIMSNSSFSWWGSFLNQNNNKKVIVPSIWFGPGSDYNYSDIYESYHIKINVKFLNGKLIYEG